MIKNQTNENCIYCGLYADTREHFIPWTYNHSGKRRSAFINEKENIYPACKECNSTLGNQVFKNLESKKEYLMEKYEKKYRKVLEMPEWKEEQIKELGYSLRNKLRIKVLAKQWILNRLAYPNVIYPEEPIRKELKKIQKALLT